MGQTQTKKSKNSSNSSNTSSNSNSNTFVQCCGTGINTDHENVITPHRSSTSVGLGNGDCGLLEQKNNSLPPRGITDRSNEFEPLVPLVPLVGTNNQSSSYVLMHSSQSRLGLEISFQFLSVNELLSIVKCVN